MVNYHLKPLLLLILRSRHLAIDGTVFDILTQTQISYYNKVRTLQQNDSNEVCTYFDMTKRINQNV